MNKHKLRNIVEEIIVGIYCVTILFSFYKFILFRNFKLIEKLSNPFLEPTSTKQWM
jgi:hypothetical protein